jgi:hypothetical protein
MYIPQYPQVADAQRLAAQQTIDAQQKQALMFSGGTGYRAPDMGGNNKETQALVNKLTQQLVNQNSQAAYDYRGTGITKIGGKGKYRTYRNKRTQRKKCKTRRRKHNKRISKRRQYKQ